ncbi:MAG: DNA polymerase II large subunit [Promethearchaeota archaeon]
MVMMSDSMRRYFEELDKKIEDMYAIARKARKRGIDPSDVPETNVASDIAGRVEELIGPKGVAKKIRELNKTMDRDQVAFRIAEEIVEEMKDQGIQQAADLAIRCALAIKTEGVVSAPLEGISDIRIKKDPNGDYLSIYFAGPIRAAGGTTQAYVVLLADHIRKLLGLKAFIATKEEVERYIEEIRLYSRAVNLQYPSTHDELEWIASHVPVEVTGDPTGQGEVSGHRNLPRVETNAIRGGSCLVLNDGVLAKASKLLKFIDKLGIEGWDWLKHIPKEGKKENYKEQENDKKFGDDLNKTRPQDKNEEKNSSKKKVDPKKKFIAEIIAGRPIFSHPSAHGGFRIRYGRSRNMGLAGYGFHPATMYLTDDFLALGTQLRVERPGKSTVVMPVDSIEGPIVRLKNGDVIRVESIENIEEIKNNLDQILFIGDVLIGYGEFLENNHKLLPSPYCEEWWILEVRQAMKEKNVSVAELATKIKENPDKCKALLEDFFNVKPSPIQALEISRFLDVPLHPRYIYFWNGITINQFKVFRQWVMKNKINNSAVDEKNSIICQKNPEIKKILDRICFPHAVTDEGYDLGSESIIINEMLALHDKNIEINENEEGMDVVSVINKVSRIKIRDKAPYFMGTRMGRPEKAKERKMKPPVHVLFPLGHGAGSQRVFQEIMTNRKVRVEVANKYCTNCNIKTYLNACPKCKERTKLFKICPKCKTIFNEKSEKCPECGAEGLYYSSREINLVTAYNNAIKKVRMKIPSIKGVKGMSSKFKIPEPLEKGMLRAKFDVYVYKDGTIRFDTGDCPLTHFKPREIGVSVEDLINLGYTHDIKGDILENEDQVLELKVQDVLLPRASLKYFFRISKFIDELLARVYGLPRYYNIKNEKDFLGHLIIGLAPHTSAGVVGRIIGFTKGYVGYAHPIFHAAKRRNCDGDEDGILLFLDVILNFSRYYLPSRIGAKMDTPLVISNRVVPEEVDSEAHNVDTAWHYPLAFYEATQDYPEPKQLVKIMETIGDRLGKIEQYEGMGFTHPTTDINAGPLITAYKQLQSMEEKINAQFELADKIAAVDTADQVKKLIQSHFTPDILGNLRSYGTQSFRCTKCGEKYRRPPLSGACLKCGQKNLVLTVSPGSIKKYLDLAVKMANKYHLSEYMRQRIEIMAYKVESTIFNGKKKQLSLSEFF